MPQNKAEIRRLQHKLSLLEWELELTRQRNREVEDENWMLRIDPLTGLEQRRLFFTTLNSKIEGALTDSLASEILAAEKWTKELSHKTGAIPLSVTFADIGYLSKYNEDRAIVDNYVEFGDHGGGDELLRQAGRLIQFSDSQKKHIYSVLNEQTRGYRLAGDEIGLIHELGANEAVQTAEELRCRFSQIHIQGSDLPPAIDAGTAHISEAVRITLAAFRLNERKKMTKNDLVKAIQQYMTALADRRSKLCKVYLRIKDLVSLYDSRDKNDRFGRNYDYLSKGAMRPKVDEIASWARIKKGGKRKFETGLRNYVLNRMAGQQLGSKAALQKAARTIVAITEKEFLK